MAIEASAVIHLAQTTKLNGKLIFAATADEEVGGALGAGILSARYPEKIMADFAINEGDEPLIIKGKTYHCLSVGKRTGLDETDHERCQFSRFGADAGT